MGEEIWMACRSTKICGGGINDQAIVKIRQLNEDGRSVTLDHLGEFVTSEEEARQFTYMCLKTLDAISEANTALPFVS